jgi:hypothetical protein
VSYSQNRRPAGANHEASESNNGQADDTVRVPLDNVGRPLPRGYLLGIDGKRYPARSLSTRDRHGLIAHVHHLSHIQGLSIRQVQGALETQHGVVRSVGSISSYLSDWTCSDCSGAASGSPEHRSTTGGAA